MQESVRLDYLAALGVTGWVPRHPLAHAAYRLTPNLPKSDPVEQVVPKQEPVPSIAQPVASVASARAAIKPRVTLPEPASQSVAAPASEELATQTEPLAAFHLQLWLAGPCALLLEVQGPGLESGMPEVALLRDILRASGLPPSPHLYAEFHWPLTRNPQFDRSSPAASLALQAFVQARLESEPIVSLGCFGAHTALLLEPEVDHEGRLLGREEALEQLPPAWFAPDLDRLLGSPQSKAKLWQQLKRIMYRWKDPS